MTKRGIDNIIEGARSFSKRNFCTVYLMSNGEELCYVRYEFTRNKMEKEGYWVAMVFENGNRVEFQVDPLEILYRTLIG